MSGVVSLLLRFRNQLILLPASSFLHHFFAFGRVRNCTAFFEISFLQQPQANQEMEIVPPESYFLYWGHFLPLQVVQFLTFDLVQFLTIVSLYVFPHFEIIGHFKKLKKPKTNWKPNGQFLTFENLGYAISNITCFVSVIPFWYHLFSYFCFFWVFDVMLALFQETSKIPQNKRKTTIKNKKEQ